MKANKLRELNDYSFADHVEDCLNLIGKLNTRSEAIKLVEEMCRDCQIYINTNRECDFTVTEAVYAFYGWLKIKLEELKVYDYPRKELFN